MVTAQEESKMTSRRELLRVALSSASLAVVEFAVTTPGQTGENAEQPAKWFWIPGHAFTLKAVGEDTEKVFTWILAENKPREGVVLHQHSHEDECFYILDGRYEMTIGDRTAIGTSGSFFFGPRNTPHR
jgi:quercetin dioxygenase-like cupin family protein